MSETTPGPNGPAYDELVRQRNHYENQAGKWLICYYGTKFVTLALGASIPVMTTWSASPVLIAFTGGLIVVVEGTAQIWQFHDRYLAARVLSRGLDKERILFDSSAGGYADAAHRQQVLSVNFVQMLDNYGSQVLKAFEETKTSGDDGKSAPA